MMKRFLAVLVAAMLAFSVCVPAFASSYPSPSSTDSETTSAVEDALDDAAANGSDVTATTSGGYKIIIYEWDGEVTDEMVKQISAAVSALIPDGMSISDYELTIYAFGMRIEVTGDVVVAYPIDVTFSNVSAVTSDSLVAMLYYINGEWVEVYVDQATGQVIGTFGEIIDDEPLFIIVLNELTETSGGTSSGSSGSSSSSSSSSGSSSSSSSTSPKTDDINMAPYVTLCVLALAGAVVAGKKAFAK